MNKRLLGIIIGLGLVFTACSSQEATPSESNTSKDTFTYAINGDPASQNPLNVNDRWGLTLANMIYSPLVRIEEDGSQKMELAESVESTDEGKSLTVILKENVKWSDGEDFTADDVVFTYTNKAKKENGNADALWIGDQPITAEKIDDLTVKFNFPEISAAAANNIATETYIMPEHIYKDVADLSAKDLKVSPVGTGPYVMSEYKHGEYIQLKANDTYYGGKASVENVTLRIIASADTTKVALQKGEVDASMVLPSDIEDLKENSLETYIYSENRVGYLGLNMNSDKLSDQKVRQGIFYALDKNEMNQAAYLDEKYYANPYSFLPPNNPFATDEVEKYETNVDTAKKLLQDAGNENMTLTLGFSSDSIDQSMQATLIQQQLQQVGITVELAGGDATALFTEMQKSDTTKYDLFLGGYIMGNDPDLYSSLYKTGAGSNYFHYANSEVDELFQQGAVELDETKRQAIYNEIQEKIMADAVIYPIVDNKKVLAVSNSIEGIEDAHLVPIYTFEDLSKITIK